jgi:phosphomethylpyrimidine synthase
MCGPHFCSMKITEDVRKYAAEQEIAESEALESGMQAVTQRDGARPGFPKRKEFLGSGAEVYAKT